MDEFNHFPRELLERFVAGQMGGTESNGIMSHLTDCEHCLELADQFWSEQPVGKAMAQMVDLDADTAVRLERKLVTRLHRSDLSVAILRMGTKGFLSVALGLLRPLVGAGAPAEVKKGVLDD